VAEELFRQVAAFASFGFAKSHAAAFARTAYESSFLKLFYPAQFLVGLINAQPMGFYPVEVLVNDTKRHGVAVLPVDINASSYKTTTEWVGRPGEPLPDGPGSPPARAGPLAGLHRPVGEARDRWTPEVTAGWGVRLGLDLVKGIGEQHQALLDAELARGPYRAWSTWSSGPGCPRRSWSGSSGPGRWIRWAAAARAAVAAPRGGRRVTRPRGRAALRGLGGRPASVGGGRAADGPAPARHRGPALPAITESERIGDAYAVIGLDARRQVVTLFRPRSSGSGR
jgi:hypothetical protein